MTCRAGLNDRRRVFWTTQPDACGTHISCGTECSDAGLRLVSQDGYKSFANNDYVRGLALNILLTEGKRTDTLCGYRPGSRGGHWSDSFRTDGKTSGSLIRTIPPVANIRDAAKLIQNYAKADLHKLVEYGVALSVDVEVQYQGKNSFGLVATIYGHGNEVARVGVTGTRLKNSWVWTS